ncbi:cytosolic 5'-nucleotidase 1A-like isoform X2 [Trachinotus anak]|uniref:cytosolic 5'-nucleotidase 1A-like isoform X2 n=1 Tax=Trachinotus anak TaxID=443729 RepID=UPI0039F241D1
MKRSRSSEENTKMAPKQKQEIPITIAMSSEILFKKEESSSSMSPGPAFSFVKALKAVNARLTNLRPESQELFQVKLICDKSTDLSDQFITTHDLKDIITSMTVSEEHLIEKLQENKTILYLSAPPGTRVPEVMKGGVAAAVMLTPENTMEVPETPLRVVFDGDAVIFSDESELVYQKKQLKGFLDNEREKVNEPLPKGPFKDFLEALGRLQKKFKEKEKFKEKDCPIRTYLVTSRNAGNAGYRALNTLKTWGLEIDEAYFLNGSPKGPLLKLIGPHIFFDDQMRHVQTVMNEGVVACHVKY